MRSRRMKASTDILFCLVVSLASFAVYWTVISVNEIMHQNSGARHPSGAGTPTGSTGTSGTSQSHEPSPSPPTPDSQETPKSSYQQQPDAFSAGVDPTLADLNRTDLMGTGLTGDSLVPGDTDPGGVALWRFDLRPANPAGTDLSEAEISGGIVDGKHPTYSDIWGASNLNSEGARHVDDWKREADWDAGFQRMKEQLSLGPVPIPPPVVPALQAPDVQMSAPR
jgi:hypothetical protein